MHRLVTAEDLKKYPDLISQGVQINQLYDFTHLEEDHKTPVVTPARKPAPKPVVTPVHKPVAKPAAKKVAAKKVAAKKIAAKKIVNSKKKK